MKTARCDPARYSGQSEVLAAATVSHRSNFVASGLYGTENRSKMLGNLSNVGSTRSDSRARPTITYLGLETGAFLSVDEALQLPGRA
jgi:hypothetical protein